MLALVLVAAIAQSTGQNAPTPAQAPADQSTAEGETPTLYGKGLVWLSRPSGMDMARATPAAADRGTVGKIILFCHVLEDGRLSCSVEHESPPGLGFGAAALKVAPKFRLAPKTTEGEAVAGGTIRIPIRFQDSFER